MTVDRLPLPEVVLTHENASGGILVVTLPGYGPEKEASRRAFLFDKSVDRGPVINRFCDWFTLWGLEPKRVRGTEGTFERSFFTLEWPAAPVSGHGPQTVPKMAQKIVSLLEVIEKRRPRLVIFLSCYLWQAVNVPEVLEAVAAVCGRPLDRGRRITSERLAAYEQRWEKLTMLALPQPSKNTTQACVISLAPAVRAALDKVLGQQQSAADPLTQSAASYLYLNEEKTVRLMAAHLHISKERAKAIFDSLEGNLWERDGAHGAKLKR